jgi:RNA ligase
MWIIDLCWWRPRCIGCGHRKPEFLDGMCFDCRIAPMEAENWKRLTDAFVSLIQTGILHGILHFLEAPRTANAKPKSHKRFAGRKYTGLTTRRMIRAMRGLKRKGLNCLVPMVYGVCENGRVRIAGMATTVQTAVSGFAEYHKIDTIFERDKETFQVNPLLLKSPVIRTISEWDVTEKIDGTNIRVMLSETGEVSFGGRTNAAQIPGDLVLYLIKTFQDRMKSLWIDGTPTKIVLFGEGYGPGIQKGGGLYRKDKAFILFDVLVGDKWWLEREAVTEVAAKLNIDTVPDLGRMTLDQIVDLVRIPFASKLGTAMAEGIVGRPIETLFDRRGERLIIKLKTKDFQPGKR